MTDGRARHPGLGWAGYAAATCAVLRLPVHLHLAFGGAGGPAMVSPACRAAHLATAALLALIAVLALAMVRPWGRRLPPAALIVPTFAVTVVAIAYAARAVVAGGGRLVGAVTDRTLPAPATLPGDVAELLTTVGPDAPGRAALAYAQWMGDQASAAYPPTGLAGAAPWALVLGLLLVLATAHRLGGPTARRIWLVVVGLGVLRLLGI